jgi:hypothetical protein
MSRMLGISLIFLGIVISLSGVWIVSQNPTGGAIASETVDEPVTAAIISPPKIQKEERVSSAKPISEKRKARAQETSRAKEEATTKLENEEAGLNFEKFIVKKFDRKYFKLQKWAGDKFVDGIFDESNLDPDLQLELSVGGKKYSLAVECKWRSSDKNDYVMFANEKQLERYQAFEKENGFPVFIALGLGGTPSSPDELFVFPVSTPLQILFSTLKISVNIQFR